MILRDPVVRRDTRSLRATLTAQRRTGFRCGLADLGHLCDKAGGCLTDFLQRFLRHKALPYVDRLLIRPRRIPRHGSWVNRAEIQIGPFARRCLAKRRIASLKQLQRESSAWNRRMNHDKVIINWRFTRKYGRQPFRYDKNSFTRP